MPAIQLAFRWPAVRRFEPSTLARLQSLPPQFRSKFDEVYSRFMLADGVVVGFRVAEVLGCRQVDSAVCFATRGLLSSRYAESRVSGTTIDQ